MTKSQMIKHLRIQAYALKFDDLSPRPVPRAAPANPKPFQRTPKKTGGPLYDAGSVEIEDTHGATARSGLMRMLQDVTVDQQPARQHLALHLHVSPLNPLQ
jgi:hypothetical protein